MHSSYSYEDVPTTSLFCRICLRTQKHRQIILICTFSAVNEHCTPLESYPQFRILSAGWILVPTGAADGEYDSCRTFFVRKIIISIGKWNFLQFLCVLLIWSWVVDNICEFYSIYYDLLRINFKLIDIFVNKFIE